MFLVLLLFGILSASLSASTDPTQCPKKMVEQGKAAAESGGVTGETRPEQTESIRLLLVDDQAVVRDVTARLLVASGFQVTQAASAQEALTKLDAIDLLLSDNDMPGMSGVDLAKQVRELKPALPIAIYSGNPLRVREALDALGFGIGAIIGKPYKADALIGTLRDLLKDQ